MNCTENCKYNIGGTCVSSDQGMCCPIRKKTEWQDHDPALTKLTPIIKKPLSMEAFEAVTHEQIDRCLAVLLKKSKEYSTKTDKLHNFRLAAGLEGCGEKEALFGMWAKHLVSLSDMCRSDSTYDLALWEEKITDTINYALLLYGLVREEQDEKGKSET